MVFSVAVYVRVQLSRIFHEFQNLGLEDPLHNLSHDREEGDRSVGARVVRVETFPFVKGEEFSYFPLGSKGRRFYGAINYVCDGSV